MSAASLRSIDWTGTLHSSPSENSETRNRRATFQAHIVPARVARDVIVCFTAERLARLAGSPRMRIGARDKRSDFGVLTSLVNHPANRPRNDCGVKLPSGRHGNRGLLLPWK
jgi:hypothetical protein